MSIPSYLPYFVLSGTFAIILALLHGLARALAAARWPDRERERSFMIVASVLIGWLLLSILLAALGAYQVESNDMPTIQFGVVVPILVGSLLIWRSKTVRRLIEAVSQQWLVGVQLYRALGLIFLVLYATGNLPGSFALPAGLGDIVIGLLAPVVAFVYARGSRQAGNVVAAWNVVGILDLILAVTMGFLTSPSLLRPFVAEPTSELMTVLPMVLIPVYLVPLSVLLHVASLTKLYTEAAGTTRHRAVPLAT